LKLEHLPVDALMIKLERLDEKKQRKELAQSRLNASFKGQERGLMLAGSTSLFSPCNSARRDAGL